MISSKTCADCDQAFFTTSHIPWHQRPVTIAVAEVEEKRIDKSRKGYHWVYGAPSILPLGSLAHAI